MRDYRDNSVASCIELCKDEMNPPAVSSISADGVSLVNVLLINSVNEKAKLHGPHTFSKTPLDKNQTPLLTTSKK